MTRRHIPIILVAVFLLYSISAATVDRTTGRWINEPAHHETPFAFESHPELRGIKVLWIESKGHYLDYSIYGEFSYFDDALSLYVQLDVLTDNPFTPDDLEGYRVVVINLGANWYGAFTSEEAAALADFVSDGGGLFLLGDNPGCPNSNINNIAEYFDMTFGLANADYSYQYVTVPGYTDLICETAAPGEMGDGARKWCQDINSLITGRYDLYGRGRVLGIGDLNMIDNGRLYASDNPEIIRNIFMFLLKMIP
jgi:hypothetical protein